MASTIGQIGYITDSGNGSDGSALENRLDDLLRYQLFLKLRKWMLKGCVALRLCKCIC